MAQPSAGASRWGETSDGELVARSLQGQQGAFEALFDRYARQVYNIAYRIGGPAEAEDLTQDVFLRAFRTLGSLRQPQAFAAWLYHIATNVCLDAARRKRVAQAELSDAVVDTHADESRWRSPEAVAAAGDDQRVVWAALSKLAPSQRAALALREINNMSYAEIATTMGASVGAVEILIFRARRRFREQYEKIATGAMPAERPLRCKEARAALSVILDDEHARGRERAAVLAHVRSCPLCQGEIAAQRRAERARAILPLLPLPLAVKGHVLAHLAGTVAAAGASAGATGAAGGAATSAATGSAATSAAATAASSAGTAAGTAIGAKVAVLTGAKALLVAAGITTAAVVTPRLLHTHHQTAHTTAARPSLATPSHRAASFPRAKPTVAAVAPALHSRPVSAVPPATVKPTVKPAPVIVYKHTQRAPTPLARTVKVRPVQQHVAPRHATTPPARQASAVTQAAPFHRAPTTRPPAPAHRAPAHRAPAPRPARRRTAPQRVAIAPRVQQTHAAQRRQPTRPARHIRSVHSAPSLARPRRAVPRPVARRQPVAAPPKPAIPRAVKQPLKRVARPQVARKQHKAQVISPHLALRQQPARRLVAPRRIAVGHYIAPQHAVVVHHYIAPRHAAARHYIAPRHAAARHYIAPRHAAARHYIAPRHAVLRGPNTRPIRVAKHPHPMPRRIARGHAASRHRAAPAPAVLRKSTKRAP